MDENNMLRKSLTQFHLILRKSSELYGSYITIGLQMHRQKAGIGELKKVNLFQ